MLTFPLVLAALSAGLAGGVHCVGMCGGIASVLRQPAGISGISGRAALHSAQPSQRVIAIVAEPNHRAALEQNVVSSRTWSGLSGLPSYQILLHAGRLFTYMLIGAVLGGLGTAGLLFQPYLPMQQIFFIVGNAALILLGCRLLGLLPKRHFFEPLFLKLQLFGRTLLPAFNSAREFPFLLGMGWGGLPCGLLYAVAPFAWFSGEVWSGAVLMLLFGLAALPHLLLTQRLATLPLHSRSLRGARMVSAVLLIGIGVSGLFYFDMHNMPAFLCIT